MDEHREVPLEWLPRGWWVAMLLSAVCGLMLVLSRPQSPVWMDGLSTRVRPGTWWVLLGIYLLAVPVSHLAVALPLRGTYRLFELSSSPGVKNLWPPAILGACEAVIYPTVLLLGRGDFIAVWLGLKVAGQWAKWGTGAKSSGTAPHEGRRRYYQFLIGSALGVIFGSVTYGAMKLLIVVR